MGMGGGGIWRVRGDGLVGGLRAMGDLQGWRACDEPFQGDPLEITICMSNFKEILEITI